MSEERSVEEPEAGLRLSRPGVSAVSSGPYAPLPYARLSCCAAEPGGATVGSPCPFSSASTWRGAG